MFVACGIWCIHYKIFCSGEGLMLETSAEHHIPQATNILYQHSKTSFEKNCFSAWASTLNMGLINKVDMLYGIAPTKG